MSEVLSLGNMYSLSACRCISIYVFMSMLTAGDEKQSCDRPCGKTHLLPPGFLVCDVGRRGHGENTG